MCNNFELFQINNKLYYINKNLKSAQYDKTEEYCIKISNINF